MWNKNDISKHGTMILENSNYVFHGGLIKLEIYTEKQYYLLIFHVNNIYVI